MLDPLEKVERDRHNGMYMAYTYVLQSIKDGSYYVGSTNYFKQRYEQHTKGYVRSTKSKLPVKVVFLKMFTSFQEARAFEIKIKSWKKRSSIEKMLNKPDNIAKYCPVV